MAYFNFYFLKKTIRTIIDSLFYFIKKHKILFIFICFFILFSCKKIVFGAEYTITETQINKAESLLDNTYTRYTCNLYRGRKVIFTISDPQTGIWCNDTIIQGVEGKNVSWKCYWYNESTDSVDLFWSGVAIGHGELDMTHMAANFNLYKNADMTGGYYYIYNPSTHTQPYFITSSNDLENFDNLQFLEINPGDFKDSIYLRLYNSTDNSLLFDKKLTDYDQYLERVDISNPFSDLIYRIPISALPSFNLINSKDYEFRLVYYNQDDVLSNVSVFFKPTVSQNINNATNSDINNSLNETNKKLDNIDSKTEETNNKLDNLNKDITSSDVSGIDASSLPSIDVNDPTEAGIDSIFTNLYNAFCSGEPQDIVFPIPFTNKNITLNATYVQDMLQNNNAGWLLIFIQAFWAYLFSRFIIKDISSKIGKIQSGNIEDIQNSNIKEDML